MKSRIGYIVLAHYLSEHCYTNALKMTATNEQLGQRIQQWENEDTATRERNGNTVTAQQNLERHMDNERKIAELSAKKQQKEISFLEYVNLICLITRKKYVNAT